MRKTRQSGAGAESSRVPPRTGFTLIELAVVVVIIGVLAAIALPNYVRLKEKAKEAEVKAGLHKIQTDLERFAVDHGGDYPPYLIGGDNAVLETIIGDDNSISVFEAETPQQLARDPLLREGYLDSYPSDPFLRNTLAVQQFQGQLGDPLRNSTLDGREGGTRFGPRGNLMGQCLCDARWMEWRVVDPLDGSLQSRHTWSNIQYEFYDAWAGPASRPFLPGSFMYKSMGDLVPDAGDPGEREYVDADGQAAMLPNADRDEITYPLTLNNYVLGAWGGTRSKGQDILGEEPLVLFRFESVQHSLGSGAAPGPFLNGVGGAFTNAGPAVRRKFSLMGIAPWTRGVNRAHVGPLWGSPYGPSPGGDRQLVSSNPNGLRDGLILVLTGGQDD